MKAFSSQPFDFIASIPEGDVNTPANQTFLNQDYVLLKDGTPVDNATASFVHSDKTIKWHFANGIDAGMYTLQFKTRYDRPSLARAFPQELEKAMPIQVGYQKTGAGADLYDASYKVKSAFFTYKYNASKSHDDVLAFDTTLLTPTENPYNTLYVRLNEGTMSEEAIATRGLAFRDAELNDAAVTPESVSSTLAEFDTTGWQAGDTLTVYMTANNYGEITAAKSFPSQAFLADKTSATHSYAGTISANGIVQPGRLITKSATYDKDTAPYVRYTVNFNEKSYDLTGYIGGSQTLTLTDTFGSQIDFEKGSVQVNGKDWPDVTYQNRQLTISNLANQTHYVITYVGEVNAQPGTALDANDANNSIQIQGLSSPLSVSSVTLTGNALTPSIVTGIGSVANLIQVEDNHQNPVEGAQFTIYSYGDGTAPDESAKTEVGSYSTDDTGSTPAFDLNYNTIYKIVQDGGQTQYENTYESPYFVRSNDKKQFDPSVDVITGYTLHTFFVTNSIRQLSIPVIQNWVDENDNDGLRPDSVQAVLNANGQPAVDDRGNPISLFLMDAGNTPENTWSSAFDVDEYAQDGTPITYTVSFAPQGQPDFDTQYSTQTIKDSMADGFEQTSTHAVETVDFSGEKEWDDNSDAERNRPDSVNIDLQQDGTTIETKAVTKDENWLYSFTGLKKFHDQGAAYSYTVKEQPVKNYISQADGNNISNTYNPGKINLNVIATWDDGDNKDNSRPAAIPVVVRDNDGNIEARGNLTADGSTNSGVTWGHSFELSEELDGNVQNYTVQLENPTAGIGNNYTTKVTDSGQNTWIVHSSRPADQKEIKGKLVFQDGNDQDGKRPHTVELQLYANGSLLETTDFPVNLDAVETDYSFGNHDINTIYAGNAQQINYTVLAQAVPDYTKSNQDFNFVYTREPGKTSYPINQVWRDESDNDGKRPLEVKYQLYSSPAGANNFTEVPGKLVTLNSSNSWSSTFDNVPVYANRQLLEYKAVAVQETETALQDAGYATTNAYNHNSQTFTFTSTRSLDKILISGTKRWEDHGNAMSSRPYSLTISLQDENNQDVPGASQQVDQNDWSYSFEVNKYKNQQLAQYTVKESGIQDYTRKGASPNTVGENLNKDIVNEYTPDMVTIPVEITWEDDSNRDRIRPQNFTVDIQALTNQSSTGISTKTLNDGTGWAADFNLPKYFNHAEIVYTLVSPTAPAGYEMEVNRNVNGGYDIIFVHEPEKTTYTFVKTWKDDNDREAARPADLTVSLYGEGNTRIATETITPDVQGDWTHTFDNLLKYSGGNEINYRVEENVPAGYTPDYSVPNTITNNYSVSKVNVTANLVWEDTNNQDGKRPQNVTVNLYKTEGGTTSKVESKTVATNANTTVQFDDLNKYEKVDGRKELIEYSVELEGLGPQDYNTSITQVTGQDYAWNITNTHALIMANNVTGTKTWNDDNDRDNVRPDDVDVVLYQNGKTYRTQNVTPDATGAWTYTFANLPAYVENQQGVQAVYTVQEAVVDDYTSRENHDNLTNTHNPAKVDVPVNVVFDDENDQDGVRPDSVNVTINGSDGTQQAQVVNAADQWLATAVMNKNHEGQPITWTVEAKDQIAATDGTDYTLTSCAKNNNGTWVVTYSRPVDTVKLPFVVYWDDAQNQDGVRPDEVTATLTNTSNNETQTLVLSNPDNAWKGVFTADKNFQKNAVDYEITLSSTNANFAKYSLRKYGNQTAGYAFQMVYVPARTSVSGTLKWNDDSNRDGKRPKDVKVQLWKTGLNSTPEKVAEQTVSGTGDSWTYTFDNVALNQDGQPIAYYVEAVPFDGYGIAENGMDITASYTPKRTTVSLQVNWVDDNNRDGLRPQEYNFVLKENGTDTNNTFTVNNTNGWHSSIDDLHISSGGTAIAYSVDAPTLTDYDVDVVTKDNVITVTMTHEIYTTTISGTKSWNDYSNWDRIRPDETVIQLYADNHAVSGKSVTLKKNGDQSYTFKDVPVNKEGAEGKAIVYTVGEPNATYPYTPTVSGYNITNSYRPLTKNITVRAEFDDKENQDGKRPLSQKVILYAGDVQTRYEKVLDASNKWTADFVNLPLLVYGQQADWHVVAEKPSGYETTQNGTDTQVTILNTYTPQTTSISGQKTWEDNKNQDGKRPEEVDVWLYSDHSTIPYQKQVLTADNDWKWNFTNLPVYQGGQPVTYSVQEVMDSTLGYTQSSRTNTQIVNQRSLEKTNLSFTLSFSDENNQDGIQPTTVDVYLTKGGSRTGDKVTLDAAGNWSGSFTNLDKNAGGTAIQYGLDVEPVEGYSFNVTNIPNTTQYTISGVHNVFKKDIPVTKIWNDVNNQDGKQPDSVQVQLTRNGADFGPEVTLNADNNWNYVWDNMDVNAAGKAIDWDVEEIGLPQGYDGDYKNGQLINTYAPEQMQINAVLTWNDANNQDGKRQPVTATLMADDRTLDTMTLPVDQDSVAFSYTYPKFKDGQEIDYTIQMSGLEDYDTNDNAKTASNQIDFTPTWTHTPELVNIAGTKTWNDKDNQDDQRPDEVAITLNANGTPKLTQEIDKSTRWQWNFANQPKYDQGQEIAYTITEDQSLAQQRGYYVSTSDYKTNLTNTRDIEKTSVQTTISWDDDDNRDGLRPDAVKLTLFRNGTEDQTATVTEADGWAHLFTDLDRNENGTEITWTVEQSDVDFEHPVLPDDVETDVKDPDWNENHDYNWGSLGDYTTQSTNANGVWTFTNTHDPLKIPFTVRFTFDDDDNRDGIRPQSIPIKLDAADAIVEDELDARDIRTKYADASNNWTVTWTDLPAYMNNWNEG